MEQVSPTVVHVVKMAPVTRENQEVYQNRGSISRHKCTQYVDKNKVQQPLSRLERIQLQFFYHTNYRLF